MDFVYNDILMILNFSMGHYPSNMNRIKIITLIVIIVKIFAGEMLLTLLPAMNIQIMTRLNNRQLISELPPSEGQHDYEDPTLNTLTMTLGLSSELP